MQLYVKGKKGEQSRAVAELGGGGGGESSVPLQGQGRRGAGAGETGRHGMAGMRYAQDCWRGQLQALRVGAVAFKQAMFVHILVVGDCCSEAHGAARSQDLLLLPATPESAQHLAMSACMHKHASLGGGATSQARARKARRGSSTQVRRTGWGGVGGVGWY